MQNSGSMQLIVDIIMCIYSILLVHYIYLFYHKKFIIEILYIIFDYSHKHYTFKQFEV